MEIYSLCNNARDGMSGALDYSVLINVMDMYNLSQSLKLDILEKVNVVENAIRNDKKKKDKQQHITKQKGKR